MKYQIIAKDEENTGFLLYTSDSLDLATKSFDFAIKAAKSGDDILIKSPSWESIELQEVREIYHHDIDE